MASSYPGTSETIKGAMNTGINSSSVYRDSSAASAAYSRAVTAADDVYRSPVYKHLSAVTMIPASDPGCIITAVCGYVSTIYDQRTAGFNRCGFIVTASAYTGSIIPSFYIHRSSVYDDGTCRITVRAPYARIIIAFGCNKLPLISFLCIYRKRIVSAYSDALVRIQGRSAAEHEIGRTVR